MKLKPLPIEHCAKCKKPSKQYNWDKEDRSWKCNDCYYKKISTPPIQKH